MKALARPFAERVRELEELSASQEVEADAEGAEEYLALMTEAWRRALKSAQGRIPQNTSRGWITRSCERREVRFWALAASGWGREQEAPSSWRSNALAEGITGSDTEKGSGTSATSTPGLPLRVRSRGRVLPLLESGSLGSHYAPCRGGGYRAPLSVASSVIKLRNPHRDSPTQTSLRGR
jgi:hypothetical protein